MMILVHDKYQERHKNFINQILKVPGKHILIHVNDAKEALEALAAYEFDFISMDDLDGGKEIAKEVMSWRAVDRPRAVNIHSYAVNPAREIAKIFGDGVETWIFQVTEPALLDNLKLLGAQIGEDPSEEDEEEEGK